MFGCVSVIGAAVDGVVAAALTLLITQGRATTAIRIDGHLADHFPHHYWIKDIADLALTERPALWVFALPVMVFFPVRIVLGLVIGAAALHAARAGH